MLARLRPLIYPRLVILFTVILIALDQARLLSAFGSEMSDQMRSILAALGSGVVLFTEIAGGVALALLARERWLLATLVNWIIVEIARTGVTLALIGLLWRDTWGSDTLWITALGIPFGLAVALIAANITNQIRHWRE